MIEEDWTVLARRGEYSAHAAARNPDSVSWAIDGLLPATGATVLFGTGSTGKTQLLLWLAAHIAARGKHSPQMWLGAEVKVTGQMLVLSAEDLREHLFKRIGDIAWWMAESTGWSKSDVEDVCSRIHVMPFLSMTTSEFDGQNPSLFKRGANGDWVPTKTLSAIEAFLEEWNNKAEAEGRPEDRFVGVILDSAVSMAGFEMSQSEATTNFLFHLNRMSRRQNMFWTIIGHTPKEVGRRVVETGVERLRGSAMWSTTPRTVIELRTAGSGDDVEAILRENPDLETRDVLFLSTVKANSVGADLRTRILTRVPTGGAFHDVTEQFDEAANCGTNSNSKIVRDQGGKPQNPRLAWLALVDIVSRISDGGRRGATFTRRDFREGFDREKDNCEALAGVLPEHDGKFSKRDHSLAWYLFQFKDLGAIKPTKMTSSFAVVDLRKAQEGLEDE